MHRSGGMVPSTTAMRCPSTRDGGINWWMLSRTRRSVSRRSAARRIRAALVGQGQVCGDTTRRPSGVW